LIETSERVFLGTSGWSYKEWIGPFYTKTDKSMLRAYTRVFKTVEIDSTFYRYPSKGTVMGWTRYSPEDFVYTAKLPGLITHEKKLDLERGIEEDLKKFLELMEPLSLGGKLGCILVQLPPKFEYRPKQLEDFFKLIPTYVKFAVEFRDLSWMRNETWPLLQRYNVAYTIVDEPLLPSEVHVTSEIAYFRWHGRGTRPWYDYRYDYGELGQWAPKVREVANKVKKTYGYFNNHYHGYAVENCLQIMEMMGNLEPKQVDAKKRIEGYRNSSVRPVYYTLEAFAPPRDASFDSLISFLVTPERLKRAKQIQDAELAITKQDDERIEATLREYHIIMDTKNKTILHDCADWAKIATTKKICKHIAKLLLTINRQKAAEILRNVYDQEDTWQFRIFQHE
jgi:uncharacterized protein YecE (DUF72 family)